MSHALMRHAAHIDLSECVNMCVIQHNEVPIHFITHVNGLCRTYKSHITHTNELCHTCLLGHVAHNVLCRCVKMCMIQHNQVNKYDSHMSESCHTRESSCHTY